MVKKGETKYADLRDLIIVNLISISLECGG